MAASQNCTKTILDQGSILHGGLFLHDSKKKRIKYILKKTEKTLKDKLIKKLKEKKLLTEGKG